MNEEPNRARPIEAQMAFARPSDVHEDAERPGMLRAATRPKGADVREAFELKCCEVQDWSEFEIPNLHLEKMGFDRIDLSQFDPLQSTLANVRRSGHITRAEASAVRRQITGRSFRLSSRKRLRVLFIAPEGFIMRKAGPNGIEVDPDVERSEMNDHDGALAVHADQDVHGTPLRQMMRGAAPWIFRHQSPDGINKRSPLLLVNVWIPLQQISRPLALMDRRSLDNRNHQLCYALPTEDFLDRDESRRVNDIWAFLHDDKQKWYFNADLDSGTAYVFDTLGTPHVSVVLPGEDVAEHHYLQLRAACEAFQQRDPSSLGEITLRAPPPLDQSCTVPLREAIEAMSALVREARLSADDDGFFDSDWCERAQPAMNRVVRKSIEMRAVAVLTPDVWPFNRS